MVFIRKQLVVWMIVLLASVFLFAVLTANVQEQGGSAFDRNAQAFAATWKSEGMTALFRLISHLGSTAAIACITLVSALLAGWRFGWLRGASIVAGVAAAYGLNTWLKISFDRARPDAAWGIEADGASFPSGSAMLAMAMFGLIALTVLQASRIGRGAKAATAVVSVVLIALVGLSRIYFHVHYLSDILAGYAAGIGVISLAMLAVHAAHNK
ncbi:phosphatase PAP2 family protein [Paenibacillus arenilitoris]|uniref:Phosphatase PAP2 family protein n=1 Tax=Paenibacillus arenilitoris TaxID=2772299 RepID=A0A927H7S2_9BACL|nr:phosphatase PAP2 family protein [Paenibacillus arenilitoris]MBD2869884.1 phosphatase PAP2 family protein [Paenibacillus arenilitoris]